MALTLIADESADYDPESEYLSAALSAKTWTPAAHGLSASDFRTLSRAFHYIDDYVDSCGETPTAAVVANKYPSFDYTPGIHLAYAAAQMANESYSRKLSSAVTKLAAAAAERDVATATTVLRETAALVPAATRRGTSLGDPTLFTDTTEALAFPTHSTVLNTALGGGIRYSTYSLVAARLGVGKSFFLMSLALAAAAAGRTVTYLSLEMDVRECATRMHSMIYRGDAREADPATVAATVDNWLAEHGGQIIIRDPSSGTITPSVVMAEAEHSDVVLVDYAGLMTTDGGERCIDNWQAAGSVSNALQQVAKHTGAAVIAATQLNRAALAGPSRRYDPTPQAGNIALSDAFGQDADLIITLLRESTSITRNTVSKLRSGPPGTVWFSYFQPGLGNFADCDAEKARDIIDEELADND